MNVKVEVSGLSVGDRCRDVPTGFTGTVVGIWIRQEAVQVALTRLGTDGKPVEVWFDACRLEPTDNVSMGAHA